MLYDDNPQVDLSILVTLCFTGFGYLNQNGSFSLTFHSQDFVILLIVCQTIIIMLVQRIWFGSANNPLIGVDVGSEANLLSSLF